MAAFRRAFAAAAGAGLAYDLRGEHAGAVSRIAGRLSPDWWHERWVFGETPWKACPGGECVADNLEFAAAAAVPRRSWFGSKPEAPPPTALVPLCGDSAAVAALVCEGRQVTAYDWSSAALRRLRSSLIGRQVPDSGALDAREADFLSADAAVEAGRYGLVYDRHGITSVDPALRVRYAETLIRALAPGGVIFVEGVLRNVRYKGQQGKPPPSLTEPSAAGGEAGSRQAHQVIAARRESVVRETYTTIGPGLRDPEAHHAIHRAKQGDKEERRLHGEFASLPAEEQVEVLERAGVSPSARPQRANLARVEAFVSMPAERKEEAMMLRNQRLLATGDLTGASNLVKGPPFHLPPEALPLLFDGCTVTTDPASVQKAAHAPASCAYSTYRAVVKCPA